MNLNNVKTYGIIYKIINKLNNKVYIGQTTRSFESRTESHFKTALNQKNNHRQYYFYNSIRKYGRDMYICELIDNAQNKIELDQKEQYLIKYYRSNDRNFGYNSTSGGTTDYTFTQEVKDKISAKAKINSIGEKNPNFGKKRTLQTQSKILEAFKQSGTVKPIFIYKFLDFEMEFIGIFYGKRPMGKELNLCRRMLLQQLKGEVTNSRGYYGSYTELTIEEKKIAIVKYKNRHKLKGPRHKKVVV